MRKIYFILIAGFFLLNTARSQNNLDSGLVAYYPFNGNDSDYSGKGNFTSFNNATLTADRFGNANGAYRFDGSSSYMRVPHSTSLNLGNKSTLCAWVKVTGFYYGLCLGNCIIQKGFNDQTPGEYLLRYSDFYTGCSGGTPDTTHEQFYGMYTSVATPTQYVQKSRWYFIVSTYDSSYGKLYINGQLVSTNYDAGRNFNNFDDLFFGKTENPPYPYWFNGSMDDIRIYNRALDDREVATLYNYADYPTVIGNVFVDVNNNGVYDSTDFYKPNQRIDASNGNFALTNFKGDYDMVFDTLGTFQTQIAPSNLYASNPHSYTYTFNSYKYNLINSNYVLQNLVPNFDSLSIRMIPLYNAARPGFDYPVGISYYNNGNTVLNNTSLIVNYDSSKLQYISSSNAGVVDNGLSLTLPLFNFAAGDQQFLSTYFKVKTTATLGDTLRQLVNISSSVAASDSFYAVIRGSYDPNEKDATTTMTPAQVNEGKFIDYIIRFENTGTDTAFKVVVTDELSNLLIKNSIQITSSSHNVITTVKDKKVTFTFNNIMLPPTSQNKIASHGYVAFKLKPVANLIDGTNISNSANIYFDYNVPIVTNTAVTKIKNPIVTPLKFTKYDVQYKADKKQIVNNWATTNEINVAYFNVQRSVNADDFVTVGKVNAKNKNNNEYQFTDNLSNVFSLPNTLYYRLQSIDKDGQIGYSSIQKVSLIDRQQTVSIYPNPATNEVMVSRNNSNTEKLTIADVAGKVVATIKLYNQQQAINISQLEKGVYFLSFESGEKLKMVKQ